MHTGHDPRPHAPLARLVWLLVFAATCALSGHNPKPGDSRLMCMAAASVLQHGSLAIEPVRVDVTRGTDGRYYTKYPLLCVVQCLPALLLRNLSRIVAPQNDTLELLALAIVPHALTATLAVGVLYLALALRAAALAAVWLALLAVFTTPLLVEGRVLYSETLQAVLAVFAILCAVRARDSRHTAAFIWGGLLCGLALNAKSLLVILPLALLVDQCHERLDRARLSKLACYSLPGFAVGAAVFLAYNQLRFGSPWAQGYDTERDGAFGFNVALASGLYALLFSSGKSVFAYAPILIASALALPRWWRARRRDLLLLGIPVVFTLCVTARWWAWNGDWAWGPRLVVPIMPLAALPALEWLRHPSRVRRSGVLLLAAAGLSVQLLGASIDPRYFLESVVPISQVIAPRQALDALRDDLLPAHFIPELNPIVGQYWLLERYLTQPGWDRGSDYPWKSLAIEAWWPRTNPTPPRLDLWLDSRSPKSAFVIEFACVTTAVLCSWRLRRRLRALSSRNPTL